MQLLAGKILRRTIEDPSSDVPGVPADGPEINVLASSSQRCLARQLFTKTSYDAKLKIRHVMFQECLWMNHIEILASSGQCCFTKQFLTKRALRHKIEDLLRDVLGVPTDGPQIAILASSSQ